MHEKNYSVRSSSFHLTGPTQFGLFLVSKETVVGNEKGTSTTSNVVARTTSMEAAKAALRLFCL